MERICVICGKEFTPHSNNHKTCSKDCSRELARRRQLEHKHLLLARHKGSGSIAARRLNGESLCMWCGNEFTTQNPLDKFCCDTHKILFYTNLFSR